MKPSGTGPECNCGPGHLRLVDKNELLAKKLSVIFTFLCDKHVIEMYFSCKYTRICTFAVSNSLACKSE